MVEPRSEISLVKHPCASDTYPDKEFGVIKCDASLPNAIYGLHILEGFLDLACVKVLDWQDRGEFAFPKEGH